MCREVIAWLRDSNQEREQNSTGVERGGDSTMGHQPYWPHLIARFRARRVLTQNQLAEMLRVSKQTVSRWESGRQAPEHAALDVLRSVIGFTTLATRAAWCERVSASRGVEVLLERDWRCAAMSERFRALTDTGLESLLGKSLRTLPAVGRHGVALDEAAFFDGGVRMVRAEMFTKRGQHIAEIDVWAVLVDDDQIVAHFVAQPTRSTPRFRRVEDILIRDVQTMLIDGTTKDLD
jgi:DNA-binding transcriptional regulator YiaG